MISEIRARLKKLALLFSSPEPNEALAARNAIERLLRANGLDWHNFGEMLDPPPTQPPQELQQPQSEPRYGGDRPWQQVADACLADASRYTGKEQKFLEDMAAWYSQPSVKQLDWLATLHKKISLAMDGRLTMRGYHQIPTHSVTIAEIVGDPAFQAGMNDFYNGLSLPPFDHHWEYERGRLFGAAYRRDHPYASPLDLNQKQLAALALRYFQLGEIL